MKQLVCEMCGGTDLLKQEGVFVCQSCGAKYSVDEAKRMMIDGTVEVQGTVQIDKSNETANLLANAQLTFEDKNYDEAFKLFSKVLSIDPNNQTALLFRGISSAWNSTIEDNKLPEATNNFARALTIQREKYGDAEEFFTFATSAMAEVSYLQKSFNDLYVGYYNEIAAITKYESFSTDRDHAKEMMRNNATYIASLSTFMVETIDNLVGNYEKAEESFFDVEIVILQGANVYLNNVFDDGFNTMAREINSNAVYLEKKIGKLKQHNYWDSHPDEYAEYLDKVAKRQILIEECDSLKEERKNLSTFDFSGKMELKNRINNIESTIKSISEELPIIDES